MDEIRLKIQELDGKMIKLIAERMKLSTELGKKKKEAGLSVVNKEREKMLFQIWEERAKQEKLSPELISKLWSIILEESIRVQSI